MFNDENKCIEVLSKGEPGYKESDNSTSSLVATGYGMSGSIVPGLGYDFALQITYIGESSSIDFNIYDGFGSSFGFSGYALFGFYNAGNITIDDYSNSQEYFNIGGGLLRSGRFSGGVSFSNINGNLYREYHYGLGDGYGFDYSKLKYTFNIAKKKR